MSGKSKRGSGPAARRRVVPKGTDGEQELTGVLQFMQALWALNHALDAVSKRMGTELGVTGPQRLVVRLVGCFPGISAGELAGLMHWHPSTLTGVLRRLEARGLLSRSADPLDGRRLRFRLTGLGRTIDRVRAGTVEASVAATLAEGPAAEVASAARLIRRLAARLA